MDCKQINLRAMVSTDVRIGSIISNKAKALATAAVITEDIPIIPAHSNTEAMQMYQDNYSKNVDNWLVAISKFAPVNENLVREYARKLCQFRSLFWRDLYSHVFSIEFEHVVKQLATTQCSDETLREYINSFYCDTNILGSSTLKNYDDILARDISGNLFSVFDEMPNKMRNELGSKAITTAEKELRISLFVKYLWVIDSVLRAAKTVATAPEDENGKRGLLLAMKSVDDVEVAKGAVQFLADHRYADNNSASGLVRTPSEQRIVMERLRYV